MRFANDKTLLSGLVFITIGAAALWLDQSYRLGSATAMGPGYFPMLLGLLLVALGLVNVVVALRRAVRVPLEPPALRPLVLLAAGVLAFGLAIDRFGLLPAILGLVACAALAGPRFRAWEVVAILLVLGCIAGALFVWGLGLPADYLLRI